MKKRLLIMEVKKSEGAAAISAACYKAEADGYELDQVQDLGKSLAHYFRLKPSESVPDSEARTVTLLESCQRMHEASRIANAPKIQPTEQDIKNGCPEGTLTPEQIIAMSNGKPLTPESEAEALARIKGQADKFAFQSAQRLANYKVGQVSARESIPTGKTEQIDIPKCPGWRPAIDLSTVGKKTQVLTPV